MVGVGFGEKLTDKAIKHIKCRFVDCEDAVTLSTERERERERKRERGERGERERGERERFKDVMSSLEINLFVTLVIF